MQGKQEKGREKESEKGGCGERQRWKPEKGGCGRGGGAFVKMIKILTFSVIMQYV